jgi:hypothetical protein
MGGLCVKFAVSTGLLTCLWVLGCCSANAAEFVAPNCQMVTAPTTFIVRNRAAGVMGQASDSGIAPTGFVVTSDRRTNIQGIDVSKYQGDADFKSVRDCGGRFAYIRLSGGENPDNELLYRTHWANARASDLVPGGYHNLSVPSAAAASLSGLSTEAIRETITSRIGLSNASAQIQVSLFLSRLDEVVALDPKQNSSSPT